MRAFALLLFFPPVLAMAQDTDSQTNLRTALTAKDRLHWLVGSSVGPQNMFGRAISAGWNTMLNSPVEYGPHWEGFGKRYGMSYTGVVTSNVMEASIGALWDEDPGYHPVPGQPFGKRLKHILKFTLVTENRRGHTVLAYARYTAYVGNNFLSNTWRADSEATTEAAAVRVGLAFFGRFSGNTWNEFWPDVRRKLFH
jgi:hypothetical protein